MVENKVVVLADGTWLAPNAGKAGEGNREAWVDASGDMGFTWQRLGGIKLDPDKFAGCSGIRPVLWESEPGRLHLLMPSSCGYVCRTDSEDGGRTWSAVAATDLPNANAPLDLAKLDDGILALVFNPVSTAVTSSLSPLAIALSPDNGLTWPNQLLIEEGPGDYRNPAVIPTRTGMAITYLCQQRRLVLWHGSVERIPVVETGIEGEAKQAA